MSIPTKTTPLPSGPSAISGKKPVKWNFLERSQDTSKPLETSYAILESTETIIGREEKDGTK